MTGATDEQPLVSVCMATYNCADTLRSAIDSLLAQSYSEWELIVCDDASTDATLAMLQTYAVEHGSRVTILRNDVNRKLAYSLNRCLEAARGPLIARMDGDDRCADSRLEKQVAFLLNHPEVDVVGTAMQRFNDRGEHDILRLPAEPDRWSLRGGVPFAHATIMARSRVFEDLDGYTVSKRTERGQDYDLWFRFYAAGMTGRNLQEPLYFVREDSAAIRRRSLKSRFRTFRTQVIGFRSLGYPFRWYVAPALAVGKGLVPARAVEIVRHVQSARFRRRSD